MGVDMAARHPALFTEAVSSKPFGDPPCQGSAVSDDGEDRPQGCAWDCAAHPHFETRVRELVANHPMLRASPMLHRKAKRWRKELGNVVERIGVHLLIECKLIECKLSLVAKKSRLNSETVSIPFRHSSALTLAMTRHN
jgi:hypothetical protein